VVVTRHRATTDGTTGVGTAAVATAEATTATTATAVVVPTSVVGTAAVIGSRNRTGRSYSTYSFSLPNTHPTSHPHTPTAPQPHPNPDPHPHPQTCRRRTQLPQLCLQLMSDDPPHLSEAVQDLQHAEAIAAHVVPWYEGILDKQWVELRWVVGSQGWVVSGEW
jgi:hypothetical protein